MISLVYAYHARPPIHGLDAALAEHERCVELWNELVRIDRMAEDELETAACEIPEIADRKASIAALRSQPRTRETSIQISKLYREQRKAVYQWAKANKDAAKAIDSWRLERVKSARQESPAWWHNYNRVLQSYASARSVCRQTGRRLRMHDESEDSGVLAVQIQRTKSGLGAAPEELTTGELSMVAMDEKYIEIKVDAEGNLLRLPVRKHRPLPKDARVKGVQVTWWTIRGKTTWKVCFSLSIPTPKPVHVTSEPVPLVLSWEPVEGGLRVAQCGDLECRLSPHWMARMDRVEALLTWLDASRELMKAHAPADIQAVLDLRTEDMLADLLNRCWMEKKPPKLPIPQDEHAMETIRMRADAASCYGDVDAWRRWWAYVWQARLCLWDRLGRQRREQFRLWAREVVRTYPAIIMDDRNLSRIAREEKDQAPNAMRHRAGCHYLRQEVIHQARKLGTLITSPTGAVLSPVSMEKSSAWARRKAGKVQQAQAASER